MGTDELVVSYAGYSHECELYVYDSSGTQVFYEAREGDDTSSVPDPTTVSLDVSAGPHTIRFAEPDTDICWTMYVLYSGTLPPAPPTAPAPAPPGGVYCGDSTCGAQLLADGWSVLAEWGTLSPSRFGVDQITTADDFTTQGWTVPSGFSAAVNIDDANYFTLAD